MPFGGVLAISRPILPLSKSSGAAPSADATDDALVEVVLVPIDWVQLLSFPDPSSTLVFDPLPTEKPTMAKLAVRLSFLPARARAMTYSVDLADAFHLNYCNVRSGQLFWANAC